MMRRSWKRSGGRGHGRSYAPSRMWVPVSGVPFAGITSTSVSSLFGLESPTVTLGTSVTSDPPEDLTILRMMGEIEVSFDAPATWTLGLIVQDRTWTPQSTFAPDADKRFLWTENFSSVSGALWRTGLVIDTFQTAVTTAVGTGRDKTRIDVAPRVRLEDGKSLHLVAYEEAGASVLTVTIRHLRLLMQRSRRGGR